MSGKYRHHKYTLTLAWAARHTWELVGPHGAIHFHASITPPKPNGEAYPPAAGLEVHYRAPPGHMRNKAPSQLACPLLGGWCWHDGTSLYASEDLWPEIERRLAVGDHEAIFRILEDEANQRFEEFAHVALAAVGEEM